MMVTLKEWIAALRSGEYQQGQELLHPTEDEFCCLGVYCDLIDPTWSLSVFPNTGNNVLTWHTDYRDFAPGENIDMETQEFLAEYWNDAGRTFLEIAEYLEEWAYEEDGMIIIPEVVINAYHDNNE